MCYDLSGKVVEDRGPFQWCYGIFFAMNDQVWNLKLSYFVPSQAL